MRVGLVINPIAGIGGPAGLKGSDGADIQALARARGWEGRAAARMEEALAACAAVHAELEWFTWGGPMGADLLARLHLPAHTLGQPRDVTGSADTRAAVAAFVAAGVDLIVFAGGDGTARDIFDAIGPAVPVLGVPAGVKMHSGVFTVTPADAGAVLARLVRGGLVSVQVAEVRDVDEEALRTGAVRTRFHGELKVPALGGYLQHTKVGGREDERLAVNEIIEEVVERLERWPDPDAPVVLGPGSTVQGVGTRLGHETTLLGFDVLQAGELVARDVDARTLEPFVTTRSIVVMSFGRGQGILFGRGNQQLTVTALKRLPRQQLWLLATRSKLKTLEGRPLRVDTGDPACDAMWAGLVEVITGYEDACYYRIAAS